MIRTPADYRDLTYEYLLRTALWTRQGSLGHIVEFAVGGRTAMGLRLLVVLQSKSTIVFVGPAKATIPGMA